MASLSHSIPLTSWRAATTWSFRPVMTGPLIGGLTLFGFGEGLLVCARWGATPWTVFAEGVSRHTGLSIGMATALISAFVLVLWVPLRERPGIGTIANLIVIAWSLNETVYVVGQHHPLWLRVLLVGGALEAIGLGSALYLTTGLGPGPRDGMMTSVHRHFGFSVVYVRAGIEGAVLIIGWLLGGGVGIATALYAGAIGFAIGWNLQLVGKIVGREEALS